jgi:hypothetical protein
MSDPEMAHEDQNAKGLGPKALLRCAGQIGPARLGEPRAGSKRLSLSAALSLMRHLLDRRESHGCVHPPGPKPACAPVLRAAARTIARSRVERQLMAIF